MLAHNIFGVNTFTNSSRWWESSLECSRGKTVKKPAGTAPADFLPRSLLLMFHEIENPHLQFAYANVI
jgi:hypothetical protein